VGACSSFFRQEAHKKGYVVNSVLIETATPKKFNHVEQDQRSTKRVIPKKEHKQVLKMGFNFCGEVLLITHKLAEA